VAAVPTGLCTTPTRTTAEADQSLALGLGLGLGLGLPLAALLVYVSFLSSKRKDAGAEGIGYQTSSQNLLADGSIELVYGHTTQSQTMPASFYV
jgi:hypothetical protein